MRTLAMFVTMSGLALLIGITTFQTFGPTDAVEQRNVQFGRG